MTINERMISIDEVVSGVEDGSLQEVFSTGTAAVISPLGELCYKGKTILVNDGKTGPVAQRLFDELQAIQFGARKDPHNWMVRVA